MECANCNTPFSKPGTVQLETEKSCSSDRLYYQNDFKKISDVYKLKRANFAEAKFSEACVVHIMRNFGAYEEPTQYLTKCEQEDAAPVRGQKMACVTSEYAYSMYNAYVDVMDCLAIPQRELLPKLWNESQFHVNIYGKGDDAGVGQLTGDAIREVTKKKYADRDMTELDYFRREMEKANKPSCNRILAQENAWKHVDSGLGMRCGLLTPESNPLRNLLYTGIFYRVITSRITGIHYRAGKEYVRDESGKFIERDEETNVPLSGAIQKLGLIEKLQAVGIANPSMNYLKQVLVSLAFNTGSSESTKLFDTFLKAKIANGLTITEADLDFVNADSQADIPALINIPKDETEEAKAIREAKLEEARSKAHERNLPQFLRLMQVNGSAGYVSKIAFRAKKLNNELGVGVCTQPSFLQHLSAQ